jgi:hypothetical protein
MADVMKGKMATTDVNTAIKISRKLASRFLYDA